MMSSLLAQVKGTEALRWRGVSSPPRPLATRPAAGQDQVTITLRSTDGDVSCTAAPAEGLAGTFIARIASHRYTMIRYDGPTSFNPNP